MRFAHAEVLWLLLLLPFVALVLAHRLRGGRRTLERTLGAVMAARLTAGRSLRARAFRQLLLLLAILFLLFGAARPQRGTQYVTAHRTGGDLIIALDVSESMLAEDLRPNRLQLARHEIATIIKGLRGDRVGLVAFAGTAFMQCPLTLDYPAALMFLDFMGPELIPEPGTNLAEALLVATRSFDEESEGYRALILITDGEDHYGEVEAAVREASRAGVRIFTVGIGSTSGEPIPERDESGEIIGYKQDQDGRVVLSRLDEEVLRKIARTTHGLYVPAEGNLGLDRVMNAIDSMEKRELEGGVRVLYEERYRYFLWPVLLLLLAEIFIPLRRRRRGGRQGRGERAERVSLGRAGLLGITLLLLAPLAVIAQGAGEQEALSPDWTRLLEENEVYRADHPQDPRPLHNLGNLYYEKGDLERSEACYSAAIPRWEGPTAAQSYYNLGNTFFRANRHPEARDAFLETLRSDPASVDAKMNLELTQLLLDQLAQQADSTQQQGESCQDQESQSEEEGQSRQDQESQPGEEGQSSQDQESQSGEQPEEQSPDDESSQQESAADSSQVDSAGEMADLQEAGADSLPSPDELQMMQILRGLEGQERELLKRRFQARSRNLKVEKDW